MSQEIEKIEYCPEGHSSNDFVCIGNRNFINSIGTCDLCTKEHFIQEFKTWSSGNVSTDRIIQESQINSIYEKLQWIPYDNFQNIEHIADGGHGSVYSAKIENGIKWRWNFIKQDWENHFTSPEIALKEIKDSRYDIAEFLKMIKTVNNYEYTTICYGISKNPSTQNYIFVGELFDDSLRNFLTKTFWDLCWQSKLGILRSTAEGLRILHARNLVHCNLHSGNILVNYNFDILDLVIDLGLCKLDDLILNSNNKNNQVNGSIPYIPQVLRGNDFTRKGDVYSFCGIMYEIITAQRPFADQAHDTYLMIDICNGVRPKVSDFMLNWIPEWYLDLMYRCWGDDPSKRPTVIELVILFCVVLEKLDNNIVDNDVMRQLQIADESLKNTSKSQKQELLELFSHSSKLHPQSCYINRPIHTLYGLHDLLEEIKSGKLQILILKSNESATFNSYYI
ncbi:hypothetical protein Glove_84g126 [Diversispora epigaea]|uniref:Protein kinase domain-containing protein n=1 Tax=Diversispora epigaea TaxID=1348612 RepID=A0A397JAW4_9GLOM|nr:hypothetical protein Glove_84g126 [Diversispora epigaea]